MIPVYFSNIIDLRNYLLDKTEYECFGYFRPKYKVYYLKSDDPKLIQLRIEQAVDDYIFFPNFRPAGSIDLLVGKKEIFIDFYFVNDETTNIPQYKPFISENDAREVWSIIINYTEYLAKKEGCEQIVCYTNEDQKAYKKYFKPHDFVPSNEIFRSFIKTCKNLV